MIIPFLVQSAQLFGSLFHFRLIQRSGMTKNVYNNTLIIMCHFHITLVSLDFKSQIHRAHNESRKLTNLFTINQKTTIDYDSVFFTYLSLA